MGRGLWFAAGAGAGVYAMVRGRRAAEAFTVDGLRDRWSGLTLGARLLREEVAQGQAEKETELRERFGLVPHGTPALEGGRHRAGPVTSSHPGHPSTLAAPLTSTTTDEEGTP